MSAARYLASRVVNRRVSLLSFTTRYAHRRAGEDVVHSDCLGRGLWDTHRPWQLTSQLREDRHGSLRGQLPFKLLPHRRSMCGNYDP